MTQAFKIHPSFCMTQSIYFEEAGKQLYEKRIEEADGNASLLSNEAWHISNIKGDCLALVCHMVLWFLILTLVENRQLLTKCCLKRKVKISTIGGLNAIAKEMKTDEDVIIEAARVRDICPEDLAVRVHGLKKEYK